MLAQALVGVPVIPGEQSVVRWMTAERKVRLTTMSDDREVASLTIVRQPMGPQVTIVTSFGQPPARVLAA
jgi:hypothetical protein